MVTEQVAKDPPLCLDQNCLFASPGARIGLVLRGELSE
jgi:hypothetical protein